MKSLNNQGLYPEQVMEVLHAFEAKNPHPRCELLYKTPFQLLCSVVLSAQTTDHRVNLSTAALYAEEFTPQTVIALGEQGLLHHIRSVGLAPTKAKNLVRLSQMLIELHASAVPQNRPDLEKLPGVGRKTASVVLGELYRQPTLAVDTHVFRVGKRLGWHNENSVEKAEKKMLKIIPQHYLPQAHHWLVLHGRYICKAIKPLCSSCYIAELCPFNQQRLKQIGNKNRSH